MAQGEHEEGPAPHGAKRPLPKAYRTAVLVLAAVAAVAFVWYVVASIIGRAGAPSAEVAKAGPPLALRGARGDTVNFLVGVTSVGGMWAAPDGLNIDLGDQSLQILEPKEEDWGKTISYATATKTGNELATFKIPDYPGTDPVRVQARITGTVYYPEAEVYYQPRGHVYYWNEGGAWRSGPRVPPTFVLRSHVTVALQSPEPYRYHDEVRAKHPRHQERQERQDDRHDRDDR